MKKIISIFLSVALIISCFSGIISVSAEDAASDTATAVAALTGNEDFLFSVGIPQKGDGDAKAAILEAKALGATMIRVCEPDDHDYDYLLDIIEYAEQHGMKVLLNLDHAYYDFIYDSETGKPYADVNDIDIAAITEHYTTLVNKVAGRVVYYQLGNELDKYYYTGGDQGRTFDTEKGYYSDVSTAVVAFDAMSDTIKAVDTSAKTVVTFCWLHYGFLDGLRNTTATLSDGTEITFDFDVVGMDWYSGQSTNPEYGANGTVAQYDYTYALNDLISRHGKEILICEVGLSPQTTTETLDDETTKTVVARDENGAVLYNADAAWLGGFITTVYSDETYSQYVKGVNAFALYDYIPTTDAQAEDPEYYYGLIDADGNRKDTYNTIQALYGGSDDWNVMRGGDVDSIYNTIYRDYVNGRYNCFGVNGTRVSDYAVTVGERMMCYDTDTAVNANMWSLRNGLKNGGFTYGDTTFDRIYSINAQCKVAVDNGIKYTVAANTELHIPIVVPDDATDILSYFKFQFSTDGETWENLTATVVQTTSSIQISTSFKSTMTVYSVRLYKDCEFRVLFPQLWYDETGIIKNDHDPNGDGDSPYDLLYEVNVGNIYNGAIYMLPATAYGFNAISAGETEVFTATTDLCYGNTIYYATKTATDTTYGTINGSFVKMDSNNVSAWISAYYGTDYSLTGKTYISPTGFDTAHYVEYYVAPDTVIEFDIALWSAMWTAMTAGETTTSFVFSVNNGNGYVDVADSEIYCTANANETVRTYKYYSENGCTFRVTYPDMSIISSYVDTNKPGNQTSNIIYRGAFLMSAPNAKGILSADMADSIDPDKRVTQIVGETGKTYAGTNYATSSTTTYPKKDYDICGTLVNYSSSWEWFNPDNFTLEPTDKTYVYTATGHSDIASYETVPYVDFNIAADTAIDITVGTLAKMGNFTFEFAPFGSETFTAVSADNYNVVSETAASKVGYLDKSGKVDVTLSAYSFAFSQAGVLRVKYPANFKTMYSTITSNYNTDVTFLSRSCTAFIVPPKAENIDFGDVNSDGDINILDLIRIKKAMARIEGVTYDKLAANVDGVSGIASGDMTRIKKFLLGTINSFK